ncbi:MAG: toll/interleukin-1 receptor domain-containing protein [Woeseia sp.]
MQTPEFRYRAFISYSHHDERWATWLHRSLERYRVPRRLIGSVTSSGTVPPGIAPVFRDREELPSATNLGRVINAALEQSAALIIICSPAAAKSRWVNEEIRTFQRLGKGAHIFCLIVEGDPDGVAGLQCFPEALRQPLSLVGLPHGEAVEPIAADLRAGKDGPAAALLKLVAGLLGVGLDELVRRDLQSRHRRMLAITVAAVAGMAVASVLAALALISRNEAQEQRARAEVEAATAYQTSEFLVEIFQLADPSEARGNSIAVREILDRGAARIDRGLEAQPEVRANLMHTIGRVYTGLGLYEPAGELLQRALELREQMPHVPTPEAVATANALGAALYLKGEYEAAETIYGEALTASRGLYPDGDSKVTEAMNGIADLLIQRGEFAAAEAQYVAALAIDRQLHSNGHADVARSLAGLARSLLYQRRFAESEAAWREALAMRRQSLGDDHPLVAETLNDLGSLLYFAGQVEAAEPFFREAAERYRHILGSEHPFVSSILNNLGRLLLERGELAEADQLLSEALAMDRKLKDPGHDDFVYTLNNLGLVRLGLGQVDAAIPLFEEALQIAKAHEHRVMLGEVWANLADVYWRVGRSADASQAIASARRELAAVQPDEQTYEANLASIEGAVRVAEGEFVEAERLLLSSYATISERWGEQGLFTRLAAGRVAVLHDARGE